MKIQFILPHRDLRLQEETVGGYIQADEAYTQHQDCVGQRSWLKVSTLVQKFVGTEATTLYSSSNWPFLSTVAEMVRCSVLHCRTPVVHKVFLPQALKQQHRQSNHRTCLSQTVKTALWHCDSSLCTNRTVVPLRFLGKPVQWTLGAQR